LIIKTQLIEKMNTDKPRLTELQNLSTMSKYIVENGRVRPNPQYGSTEKTTVANPERAIICSFNINDANTIADVSDAEVARNTLKTVEIVQDQ
jgi:hypothetical protein